jgi:Domain of unknown function (DUF4402)
MTPMMPLAFGTVAALGPGSVTMHPIGGRTSEGHVYLVNPDHGTPAQILVRSVQPHQAFSISLPDHFILTTPARDESMRVTGLRTYTGLNSTGPSASSVVNIGGTLHFKGQPTPAPFEGAFTLTIAYH